MQTKKASHRFLIILVFILGGVLIGLFSVSSSAARVPGDAQMQALGHRGPVLIVTLDETPNHFRVRPPQAFLDHTPATANITMTYIGPWTQAARDAFDYAASIWETQLTSGVTIEVEATWEDLGNPNILGSASASNSFRDFTGAPVAGTWYAVALANKLRGLDLDPGVEDIEASFNSTADWYLGTDGNPGGQVDFVSVVLHELGHGLGFAGSMTVSGGLGSWGYGTDYPFIYDRFTENASAQLLITSFPNNSASLAGQLTGAGGGVFFNGANAKAANGNASPRLYIPGTWQQGSSYSHLDDATFDGTINALMTHAISAGEANHDPGPITRGMFTDMGWTVQGGPTPTATATPTKTVTPGPSPTPTLTPILVEANWMPLVMRNVSQPATPTPTQTITPIVADDWITIKSETFEGSFPNEWAVDDNGTGTNMYWGQRTCAAANGAYSGWAIGGGPAGSGLACGATYPANAQSWMVYGPFSLVGTTDAELNFNYWTYSETIWDKICVFASVNNSGFAGTCYSGLVGSWASTSFDLTDVYMLGDLRGQPDVWIAFVFFSNESFEYPVGAYLDDIVVRKCTGGTCPPAAAANLPAGARLEQTPGWWTRK